MPQDWSEAIVVADLADEPQLSEELANLIDRFHQEAAEGGTGRGKSVVLNFGAVTYMSSSHLAQLLRLRKAVQDAGRQMVLCSVKDNIWSVILMTGLDRVFRFAPDPMTALATLQIEDEPGDE